MPRKCCTQYVSTFGKLSSGHSTRKCQFSSQSQRKAMPKNAQTTTQLHSSHMLAKQCSKFSKLSFNSTWTENFHMFTLGLEKAEETQRSNFQHLLDHRKSNRVPGKKKIYLYFIDYIKAFDYWYTTNLESSSKVGNTRSPDLPLEKSVCRSGSSS